jgi:Caspase domain
MAKRASVVTISEYKNSNNNLPGVANDREAIAKILGRFGIFDIESLQDSNASSANIKRSVDKLITAHQPGDTSVFYFSGHGFKMPLSGKISEALVPFESSSSSLIFDSYFAEVLQAINPSSGNIWFIIDACYSGDLFKDASLADEQEKFIMPRDIYYDGFLSSPLDPHLDTSKDIILDSQLSSNVFFFSACKADEKALCKDVGDGTKPNRSVFTWAIESALANTEKASGNSISCKDLELAVVSKINILLTPGRQTPIFAASSKSEGILDTLFCS